MKTVAFAAIAMTAILAAGCSGGAGGSTMPDNNAVRTENPNSQRPSLGTSGPGGGAAASAMQAKE